MHCWQQSMPAAGALSGLCWQGQNPSHAWQRVCIPCGCGRCQRVRAGPATQCRQLWDQGLGCVLTQPFVSCSQGSCCSCRESQCSVERHCAPGGPFCPLGAPPAHGCCAITPSLHAQQGISTACSAGYMTCVWTGGKGQTVNGNWDHGTVAEASGGTNVPSFELEADRRAGCL